MYEKGWKNLHPPGREKLRVEGGAYEGGTLNAHTNNYVEYYDWIYKVNGYISQEEREAAKNLSGIKK